MATPAPDAAPAACNWSVGPGRCCGATDGVRRYIPGHRCPLHTPAALQGFPEPQPGPGLRRRSPRADNPRQP